MSYLLHHFIIYQGDPIDIVSKSIYKLKNLTCVSLLENYMYSLDLNRLYLIM